MQCRVVRGKREDANYMPSQKDARSVALVKRRWSVGYDLDKDEQYFTEMISRGLLPVRITPMGKVFYVRCIPNLYRCQISVQKKEDALKRAEERQIRLFNPIGSYQAVCYFTAELEKLDDIKA